MSLSLTCEYKGCCAFFTYNGTKCFRGIIRFYKERGATADEIIDYSIGAFEKVIECTVFQPVKYLVDAENASFRQAIITIANSMPEILGAATEGYIDTGKNRGGGARYKNGLKKYIFPELSIKELCKIDAIHYKQIRNALSHSFVVSNIWLESDGESNYVTSEEVHKTIIENKDQFGLCEAELNSLRENPYNLLE